MTVGHADHGDTNSHGDHHHEAARVPYRGQRPPFENIPMPSMASEDYKESLPAFDNERAMPLPRGVFERFSRVLQLQFGQDPDMPLLGSSLERKYDGWFDYITSPWAPLRPRNYVDAYTRPNPCPEEYWWASWRWPRTKYVNAKVPPPVDGKYTDYYHYLAYKNWLERERDVYVAHANLVNEMTMRCLVKEGQYNAAKNCRHLYNKQFSMSRMEELNQALLYMAITGNAAIRETPYPENFVDEKRKIYDDWLHRTRMRKPGDVAAMELFSEDESLSTQQECARIMKLARAVEELVALNFALDEKEMILDDLEGVMDGFEEELQGAENEFERECRRCAILCIESSDKKVPRAARGDNHELTALWREHGDSFMQQYERHITRYNQVWKDLLVVSPEKSSRKSTEKFTDLIVEKHRNGSETKQKYEQPAPLHEVPEGDSDSLKR